MHGADDDVAEAGGSLMLQGVRSAITLIFLCAVLAAAGIWGWTAATEPLPEAEDLPPCDDERVAAGQKVYPDQVSVSVFNASTRTGLAGRTSALFVDKGFGDGTSGNAPRGTTVSYAQVWTSEPRSPAVRLVRSHLGPRADVVDGEPLGVGVIVVVGQQFDALVKGRKWVKAREEGYICSPPGTGSE